MSKQFMLREPQMAHAHQIDAAVSGSPQRDAEDQCIINGLALALWSGLFVWGLIILAVAAFL